MRRAGFAVATGSASELACECARMTAGETYNVQCDDATDQRAPQLSARVTRQASVCFAQTCSHLLKNIEKRKARALAERTPEIGGKLQRRWGLCSPSGPVGSLSACHAVETPCCRPAIFTRSSRGYAERGGGQPHLTSPKRWYLTLTASSPVSTFSTSFLHCARHKECTACVNGQ